MASRIFWVVVSGLALVTGMVVQDGGNWLVWNDGPDVAATTERAIEARVDRVIERSVGQARVVGADGQEVDVPAQTKRAMAEAVGRLVKAEADLAILRVSDAGEGEIQAANALRDQARADVDRLKAEIGDLEQAARTEQDAVREQVQRQIRDGIRSEIREAVRN